jgi:N-acetylneuraminic acid mutarotase
MEEIMRGLIVGLIVAGALATATGAAPFTPPESFGARAPAWEPDTQVTDNSMNNYLYYSNGHRLVIARNGVRHLVWHNGSSVYYKRYYPGEGWTPDTMLSGAVSSFCPSVALDSDGASIHVVWEAYQHIGHSYYHIVYDRCTPTSNGNGGWDTTRDICTSHDSAYHYYPVVACAPNRVAVSWYEYNAGGGAYMVGFRECLSGAWQNQVELDSIGSSYYRSMPSLAVAPDGDVFLTYYGTQPAQSSYHVYVKRRLSNAWQATEDATPMLSYAALNCIALNPLTVRPHVVCYGMGNDGYYRIYHNWRGGAGWQSSCDTVSQPGPTPGRSCYYPNIEFTRDGAAEVTWFVYPKPNGGYGVRFNERSPAGDWGAPVWLSDSSTSYSDYYPNVATDVNGGVYVVWYSSRTSYYQVWLKRRVPPTNVGFVCLSVPAANVDSVLSAVAPVCTTCNYGALSASYNVRLRIGSFYDYTVPVGNHPSQTRLAVQFPAFSDWPRGDFLARCSLSVSGDTWFADDTLAKRVTGHVHDVRCDTIIAPVAVIDSAQPPVTPRARISNRGSDDETFSIGFRLTDGYNQSLAVSVAHSDTHTYSFPVWNHRLRGTWLASCSTRLTTDVNHANDALQRTVLVRIADIAVSGIDFPVGTVDSADPIAPRVRLRNNGSHSATFDAWFRFDTSGGNAYSQHVLVNGLSPALESLVSFPAWPQPHRVNNYVSRCSVYQAGDINRRNDTLGGAFIVRASTPPQGGTWTLKTDVPLGNRRKNVKAGGALAYGKENGNDTGFVFAFKGNSTAEFYRYNPVTSDWISQDTIPLRNRTSKKKKVNKGATLAMTAVGKVYATKGNNCNDFWEYDPEKPTGTGWNQKADVPTGARAVKDGAGLVAVHDGSTNADYLYLLKGAGTSEFYRYSVAADSWTRLSSAPVTGFKNGSCLASDDGDTIFALRGSTNEFFAYSISGLNWQTRLGLPFNLPSSTRRKKVKDGAGLAYANRIVYALKGGGVNEFWSYECDVQNWVADNPMAPSPMNKTVKAGGALVYARGQNALYALRGNNTREFWTYTSRTLAGRGSPVMAGDPQDIQGQAELRTARFALRIAPNPFSGTTTISYSLPGTEGFSLKLYDVTGNLLQTLRTGHARAGTSDFKLRASDLPRGIYLLRLEAHDFRATRKLVVE